MVNNFKVCKLFTSNHFSLSGSISLKKYFEDLEHLPA